MNIAKICCFFFKNCEKIASFVTKICWNFQVGEVVNVPVGTKHRVENREDKDLKFIEVQVGTYFGEDDIVRLEDDYGRDSWVTENMQ